MDENRLISTHGELRLCEIKKGEWKQPVELWLLNDAMTRNDWRYENLPEHAKLFAGTPILVAYVGTKIGDGHNYEEVVDSNGQIAASFMAATAERVVGYFASEEDIEIRERGGKQWIVGRGYIWTWYARELVAKLKKQGLEGMKISIETLITRGREEDGKEVFEQYVPLGTTILGDDVTPAVAGANIRALSAIGLAGVKEMTLRVASINKGKENSASKSAELQKNQKSKKGVSTMKIKELETHFPDFRVLAVDGENVALLSAEGEAYITTAKRENGEVIIGGKIALDSVPVSFANDEATVNVELGVILSAYNAKITKLEADYAAENSARKTAEAKCESMEKAELRRRCAETKTALMNRYKEIVSGGGCKVEASVCDEFTTDERLNAYAVMVNSDGEWIGAAVACKDLDAVCMNAIISEGVARNNANKSKFAWDLAKNTETETKSLLDRVNNFRG